MGSVRASHQVMPNGALRERPAGEYPKSLQPRDYSAVGEQEKVSRIAKQMSPDVLITNHPAASEGPPTITADGTVVNGNGRQMALERAAQVGSYAKYRQALVDNAGLFGLSSADVERMQRPVLYRTVDMDPHGPEASAFAAAGNVSLTQGQSPVRTAASLNRLVTPEVIDSLKLEGDTTFSEAVTDPVKGRAFRDRLRGELPPQEQARFFHEDGRLTDAGTELVRNLLMTKVLPTPLVERMGEDMKAVKRTIEGALPQLIEIQRDTPAANIGPQLAEALDVLMRNPKVKTPAQADALFAADSMFGGKAEPITPGARMMVDFVLENGQKPLVFRKLLSGFANDLAGRGGLFGEEYPDVVKMAAENLGVKPRPGAFFGDEAGADREVAGAIQEARDAGHSPAEIAESARSGQEEGLAAGRQAGGASGVGGQPAAGEPAGEPRPGGAADFGRPLSDAERRAGPGGGQPDAGERRLKETALANAKIEAERQLSGLPPILSEARRTNPEVWDRAMARFDSDPDVGRKLVESLLAKPRATTVDENAILLRQKVAIDNEYRRVVAQYLDALKSENKARRDLFDFDALERREADLAKQRDDLDKVARQTGTEWGRAGQFRRQLAKEDFSLGSMLSQFRAAKGEAPTPEELQRVAALQQKIEDLQGKLDAAEKALRDGGMGYGSKAYLRWRQAQVAAAAGRQEFAEMLGQLRQGRKPLSSRLADLLIKLRVNEVISAPTTLGKIAVAAASRAVTTPLEEAAGSVLTKIVPGLSRVAAAARREGAGFSPTVELKSAAGFIQGVADAWQVAKTGQSDLDVLHNARKAPRGWLDLQFGLHDAMKAPAVRAEYERSIQQRIRSGADAGEDVSSPAALLRISGQAYVDAQAAKFRNENWLVDAANRAIDSMRQSGNPVANAAGVGARLLMPVMRVPTNLAFEVANHVFGTGLGAARLTKAWMDGIDNLKPYQADLIMRNFKKGALGAAALAVGYFNPTMFGGYYSGKRKDSDVPAGAARLGGADVPAWLLHNPLVEALQVGATVRRASDAVYKGHQQGTAEGLYGGLRGWVSEIPLARETTEAARALSTSPRERGRFFGELAKSFAVPQLVQWLAKSTDANAAGNPVQRRPHTVTQSIESGVPGLRQKVPTK